MKSSQLRLVDRIVMRPVASKGRKPNTAYRVREHLTEEEVNRLLAALKSNRYGQRDWLIGLLIYRHGLRVSEACDLRWDDINLAKRTIQVSGLPQQKAFGGKERDFIHIARSHGSNLR